MTKRNTVTMGAMAAAAGLMAFSAAATAPTYAAAQYYGGGYYDPCQRDQTNRGTVGALVGGALGAAIGSNAAARNARTEGALLGGALGAVGGAVVGNRSAACDPGYTTSYNRGYAPPAPAPVYGYNDGRQYDRGYYGAGGSFNGRNAYDYGRADYDRYAYDQRGNRYPVTGQVGADGCTLAESPIYLPDGRVQKRFVRVCQDSMGRYQVVD